MTRREVRRERCEAERNAKKLDLKKARLAGALDYAVPVESTVASLGPCCNPASAGQPASAPRTPRIAAESVHRPAAMRMASFRKTNASRAKNIDEKQLSLLLRYQITYQRAFYKSFNALICLKKEAVRNQRGFVS
jgi:hypothetical protein